MEPALNDHDLAELALPRDFPVRRSELTVPGHDARMMGKAAQSGADEVILDLEDACAASQKVAARATVAEALRTLDFGRSLRAYRINPVSTPLCLRDLTEVLEGCNGRVDAVVLPKVEHPDEVRFVDRLIGHLEASHGWERGRIRLEALLETAGGIQRAFEIATASPRMASLIFGVADYAGDLGARGFAERPFEAFHHAKSTLLVAARAAGLAAIDHVTVQFRELDRVAREAEAAADMGFDGKWAIHPSHLAPIHAAFSPRREEVEQALALFRAYGQADRSLGRGAIVVGDRMVDAASLRVEWKRLALARKAGLLDAEDRWKGP